MLDWEAPTGGYFTDRLLWLQPEKGPVTGGSLPEVRPGIGSPRHTEARINPSGCFRQFRIVVNVLEDIIHIIEQIKKL